MVIMWEVHVELSLFGFIFQKELKQRLRALICTSHWIGKLFPFLFVIQWTMKQYKICLNCIFCVLSYSKEWSHPSNTGTQYSDPCEHTIFGNPDSWSLNEMVPEEEHAVPGIVVCGQVPVYLAKWPKGKPYYRHLGCIPLAQKLRLRTLAYNLEWNNLCAANVGRWRNHTRMYFWDVDRGFKMADNNKITKGFKETIFIPCHEINCNVFYVDW